MLPSIYVTFKSPEGKWIAISKFGICLRWSQYQPNHGNDTDDGEEN